MTFDKNICLLQYLKRIHSRAGLVLERFALLFCIGIVWAFAAILTVSGAYNNVKTATKQSCRTDRSYLMSSAPWYVYDMLLCLHALVILDFYRCPFHDSFSCFVSRIKIPYPFQWGTPIFRASHVFGMIGAALVSSAEV